MIFEHKLEYPEPWVDRMRVTKRMVLYDTRFFGMVRRERCPSDSLP